MSDDGLLVTSPVRLETNAEGVVLHYEGEGTGRRCGQCRLCCKLLPVPPLHGAGERCRHSKAGKGCAIYANRPDACVMWSCRWLIDPLTADLPRPDRAHYVIDMMTDDVTLRHDDTGTEQHIPVLQVWIDPNFREAAHAPELRRYLARMGEYGYAALLRFSSSEALTVFPPTMSADGQWHDVAGEVRPRKRGASWIAQT